MNHLSDLNELNFSKSFDELKTVSKRSNCPSCGNLRRYYCYDCVVPLGHVPPSPGRLPIRFHIVRHASEKPSKSSVIPLKLIYPDDVFLYTFRQANRFDREAREGTIEPELEISDWSKAALLFPTDDAVSWAEHRETTNQADITDIVVIDSTWSTAMQVIKTHAKISGIKLRLKLGSSSQTLFWRHQNIDRSCLATCEAVYVFLREFAEIGNFDDVLFYYVFVHNLITDYYRDTKKHRGHLPQYTIVEEEGSNT